MMLSSETFRGFFAIIQYKNYIDLRGAPRFAFPPHWRNCDGDGKDGALQKLFLLRYITTWSSNEFWGGFEPFGLHNMTTPLKVQIIFFIATQIIRQKKPNKKTQKSWVCISIQSQYFLELLQDGLCFGTAIFKSCNRFSTGLRYGLWPKLCKACIWPITGIQYAMLLAQ